MLVFGLWVFGSAVWGFVTGSAPHAETMGLIGALALAANVAVALMLYRYRTGDANMRSVWICSRNDAISASAAIFDRSTNVGHNSPCSSNTRTHIDGCP